MSRLEIVRRRAGRIDRWRSLRRRERLGRWGERIALAHLLRSGWDVVACNWSCRAGELDLVAFEKDTLVVVEVKTRRRHPARPPPEEQVDEEKEARLEELAWRFAARYELEDCPLRFDVIAVETEDRREYELRHHRRFF